MSKYILTIDAGTTGITASLFDKYASVIHKEYSEFEQIYPKPGWVEHNPEEIWTIVKNMIKKILTIYPTSEIKSIGITNQRETTVLWNKQSGKAIHNAIVWQCRRTKEYCNNLANNELAKTIMNKTGLVIDSYFSASKINWILENIDEAKKLLVNSNLLFGTIDTWIIWKITQGRSHVTDHTNASRTMLYNIDIFKWDEELLEIFKVPKNILPSILNSTDSFGITSQDAIDCEIPINGVAGDQQSSLFGQAGFNDNDAKCTYGTGCFLLINTGDKRINSTDGLLTTIACNQYGKPSYAIEGSVFIGGAVIQWLRDGLKILNNASESEEIAKNVDSSNGIYIVPAFTGLGTPYWDMEARGLITGITRGTTKDHIIRAALESIAYQVYDIINIIKNNLDIEINTLKVDGGATENDFLLQFQSDILNINIERPTNVESTSLGAALLAGIGSGFWNSNDVNAIRSLENTFQPTITSEHRNFLIAGWKKAIQKTIN